jgi:hypothetical protein
MTGTAVITLSGNTSVLRLVIGMDGAGTISFTGAGGLSMIVPFDGTGAFGITGAGDLKGRLSMDGSWTPFTALSPEGLAAAVLDALNATEIPVNIKKVNDVYVTGDGQPGTEWGP